jgi:hypothetical protein
MTMPVDFTFLALANSDLTLVLIHASSASAEKVS